MNKWKYYFACIGVMCSHAPGAYWGSQAVSVLSESLSGKERHCIVMIRAMGGETAGPPFLLVDWKAAIIWRLPCGWRIYFTCWAMTPSSSAGRMCPCTPPARPSPRRRFLT